MTTKIQRESWYREAQAPETPESILRKIQVLERSQSPEYFPYLKSLSWGQVESVLRIYSGSDLFPEIPFWIAYEVRGNHPYNLGQGILIPESLNRPSLYRGNVPGNQVTYERGYLTKDGPRPFGVRYEVHAFEVTEHEAGPENKQILRANPITLLGELSSLTLGPTVGGGGAYYEWWDLPGRIGPFELKLPNYGPAGPSLNRIVECHLAMEDLTWAEILRKWYPDFLRAQGWV